LWNGIGSRVAWRLGALKRSAMSTLTEEQARAYMHKLLAAMSQAGGSTCFISADFPPSMKAHGTMQPLGTQKLTGENHTHVRKCHDERAAAAGSSRKSWSATSTVSIPGLSRFRVNVFVQQRTSAW
jgi:twitching motility protein PilU